MTETEYNPQDHDPKLKNLIGMVVGRWTVLRWDRLEKPGKNFWLCRCKCGVEKTVVGCVLRNSLSQSCGCLQKELTSVRSTRHGYAARTGNNTSQKTEYQAWRGCIDRCNNPNWNAGRNYRKKGRRVCVGIKESFIHFLQTVGAKPFSRAQLDRRDNDGHYSCGTCEECRRNNWPMNIRWVNGKTNGRNKSNNLQITYRERTQPLSAWCEELKLPYARTYHRLRKYGWTPEEAFTS